MIRTKSLVEDVGIVLGDEDGDRGEEAIDPWWIPEGEKREHAKGIFEIWAEIKGRGRAAHCAVEVIFTSPSHYGLGIRNLTLSWGTQKADGLGLDCYVESSQTGVPLYTKDGFERIRAVEVKPDKEEFLKSKEWKKIDDELVKALTVIWRPCRKFEDSKGGIGCSELQIEGCERNFDGSGKSEHQVVVSQCTLQLR